MTFSLRGRFGCTVVNVRPLPWNTVERDNLTMTLTIYDASVTQREIEDAQPCIEEYVKFLRRFGMRPISPGVSKGISRYFRDLGQLPCVASIGPDTPISLATITKAKRSWGVWCVRYVSSARRLWKLEEVRQNVLRPGLSILADIIDKLECI